ncbi:MAG: hypothetical protein GX211_11595 [Clostridiaceae bacterium]|jgi:hypothetical protein|nr:hypothetical protein [Clostridiaceae bacterium]
MAALYIILAVIAVFITIILIRTAMFKPPAEKAKEPEEVSFNEGAAVSALQELVRCRTVSFYTPRWRMMLSLKNLSTCFRSFIRK